MRKLLLPLSWLYGIVILVRNFFYAADIFTSEKVSKPVISVGNITTGGNGKTPCVEYIVDMLLKDGRIPAVVSRGYSRKSKGVVVVSDGKGEFADVAQSGDEPLQIAKKFPRAIVVIGEKKVDAARKAVLLGADCIIADDAFQHRQIARTLDIVLCGEELAMGKNTLLPAGNGREPLGSLSRANIVLTSSADKNAAETNLRHYSYAPLVFFETVPVGIVLPLRNETHPIEFMQGKRIFAFTGIANPKRFLATATSIGGVVVGAKHFGDHHWFTEEELRSVVAEAKRNNAVIATTEKDWQRIAACRSLSVILGETELLVVQAAMKITSNEERFTSLVRATVGI
jgi:tetraacyldisaccharide 4'-kinase